MQFYAHFHFCDDFEGNSPPFTQWPILSVVRPVNLPSPSILRHANVRITNIGWELRLRGWLAGPTFVTLTAVLGRGLARGSPDNHALRAYVFLCPLP